VGAAIQTAGAKISADKVTNTTESRLIGRFADLRERVE